MVTLFDQERVTEIHEYNLIKDARLEGREEGRAEGREEGREEGICAMVSTLKKLSLTKEAVAQELTRQFFLLQHIAEEKTEQYWRS